MSRDQNFAAAFRGLDQIVEPEPAFTAALRSRFLTAANGAVPLANANQVKRPVKITRRKGARWFDLAAAAVLVLSIIGGVARVTTSDAPILVIQAPVSSEQVALMRDGSAARDGQFPGKIPPADAGYALLWEEQPNPAEIDYLSGRSHIYGDILVRTGGNQTGSDLRAYALRTGQKLWRVPVDKPEFGYAITSRGVVIAVSENPDSIGFPQAFAVTLLDLETGEPIWQSGFTYELDNSPEQSVLVADDAIYFVDGGMTMVALELATGVERWRYDAAQGRSNMEMVAECVATSAVCGGRAFRQVAFAAGPDALYMFAPVPGEVVSLSLANGTPQWIVNTADRTGMFSLDLVLLTTDHGVVVQASNVRAGGSLEISEYLGLWSILDGAEIWNKSFPYSYAVSTGNELLLSNDDDSNPARYICCTFTRIEIATGQILAMTDLEELLVVSYYPESDAIELTRSSGPGMSVSLRTQTSPIELAFILHATTTPSDPTKLMPDCAMISPSRDGKIAACQRPNGLLAVYEVLAADTTAAQLKQGDELVTTVADVNLRREPASSANVDAIYAEVGTRLQYIGETTIDAEGNLWYQVRDEKTALTGYILAEHLSPAP